MAADGLTQRLIGGAALLVIGVVAWFWLLSADSPVDPVSRTTQIPPAPDIQPFSVPQPVAPKDVVPIDSAPAPVAQRADSGAATQTEAAPTPAAEQSPAKAAPPAPSVTAAKVATRSASRPLPETFELDQQGLPVAWVVQVGLFSSQANADKIKATLLQKGFKTYTQMARTPQGAEGVKVLVGPKLSRERAEAQKKAIDQLLKTNTMLVRFTAG